MTQIAVSSGSSASVTLAAGNRALILGQGTYRIGPRGTSSRPTVDELIDNNTSIGPYEADCTVQIWSTGSTTYELVTPSDVLDQTGRPIEGAALRSLVSGAGIVGASKIPKMLASIGRAAYERVNWSIYGHSIPAGASANGTGTYTAADFATYDTQSYPAILAKILSASVGGTASSSGLFPGGPTDGSLNPLITLGGTASIGVDGNFGPGGARIILPAAADTMAFVAVGTAIRVYCAASGAGSTTPARYFAPSISGGAVQNATLPAASPNPGNTPVGDRTWYEFTISPVVPGEVVTLQGMTTGNYSVYFVDRDYKTTAGVTVNRLCQSGAALAAIHAAALDNADTQARQGGWIGSTLAIQNRRLGQAQSMSVRVPKDGFILHHTENDLNDWAAYGYTLADLTRHLTNVLTYEASLGYQGVVMFGTIRDPAFQPGTRPYNQADIIAAYKTVVAASTNAAYIDFTAPFGGANAAGYAALVAAGLLQDIVHPNKPGHGYEGVGLGNAFLAAAANRSS